MTAPLVSLVLPVYNQADHVADIVAQYVDVLRRGPAPYEDLPRRALP
jgi:hypothetical protein